MFSAYEHTDPVALIAAWMAERPGVRTQRYLARALGCSPTQVNLILHGQRRLPLKGAAQWAAALRLEGEEVAYFDALVRSESAPSEAMRAAAEQLAASMREWHAIERESGAHVLYSRWYTPAILELARCRGASADPAWIAQRLWPPVSEGEAAAAVEDLVRIGLLDRTDEGGLTVATGSRATVEAVEDDALSANLRRLHLETLEHAAEALEVFPQDERFFAAMTLAIPEDGLADLVQALMALQVEALGQVRDTQAERVVQIAMQLFPRTREPDDR